MWIKCSRISSFISRSIPLISASLLSRDHISSNPSLLWFVRAFPCLSAYTHSPPFDTVVTLLCGHTGRGLRLGLVCETQDIKSVPREMDPKREQMAYALFSYNNWWEQVKEDPKKRQGKIKVYNRLSKKNGMWRKGAVCSQWTVRLRHDFSLASWSKRKRNVRGFSSMREIKNFRKFENQNLLYSISVLQQ